MHTLSRRLAAGSPIGVIVAVPLIMIGLVGCGGTAATRPPLVVAVTGTANEPSPALGRSDLGRLVAAAEADNGAVILVPSDGAATTLPLTPRRSNGQVEHGPRRTELLKTNLDTVEQTVTSHAATGPYDLLELMATATRTSTAAGTLLVLSSGVSTAGGLDMRAVLWGADPALVARQLRDRGLLPSLDGWTVVFSGLGETMPPQPALAAPQRRALIAYWTSICAAAGAIRCLVNDEPRERQPSRSAVPVPVVPVPETISVQGPQGETVSTLPADMLFGFDSATLDPSALQLLAPMAARAREGGRRVRVTGYASPDGGTAAFNIDLSQRRADAVHAALVALGVPPAQFDYVRGAGTDAGTDACVTEGLPDPAKCAHLRRVVVVTSPTSAPSS